MSVLAKARKGGADYIYSLLLGYDDPPAGIILDDGFTILNLGMVIKLKCPFRYLMI